MKRRAISQVLTTVIILVASVVLASGVVLYGTSLFQVETQQTQISTQGTEIWVNSTDPNEVAWGAVGIRNSGDKIISVSTIEVRGVSVPFSSWFAERDQDRITTDNFQSKFVNNGTDANGDMLDTVDTGGSVTTSCAGADPNVIELDFDGNNAGGQDDKPTLCLSVLSGPLSLNPGERSIIYFRIPDGTLSRLDSGEPTRLNIFASSVLSPETVTVSNP